MLRRPLICSLLLSLGWFIVAPNFSLAVTNISIVIPAGNSLLCNPLDGTNGNSADQILRLSPLSNTYSQPSGTLNSFHILTFNGFAWDSVYYENDFTGPNTGGAVTNGWATDGSGTAQAIAPQLGPGRGFFISNAGNPMTNTFVGNITPAPGHTNIQTIAGGFNLTASVLPVSGSLTNSAFQFPIASAGSDLPPPYKLSDFCVYTWNGSGYDSSCYDSGFGGGWDGPVPNINVGEGFWINNLGPPVPWAQTQP